MDSQAKPILEDLIPMYPIQSQQVKEESGVFLPRRKKTPPAQDGPCSLKKIQYFKTSAGQATLWAAAKKSQIQVSTQAKRRTTA